MVPINTLSDASLEKLMPHVKFSTLKKGEVLFKQGDNENYSAYLLSGMVVLKDKEREVDVIVAGSDMARFPLSHQLPRKFSVVAKTKAQVACVDSRELSELISKSSASAYEVSDFDAEATDDWMGQLLQSRVFQHIPASNIQGVMMHMEEQEVMAGEVVIRQGEEGDYFYLVNRGNCSVLRADSDMGESVEVAQLGPGSSFGEEALISDKPRGSTVVMLTDGVLLRLAKSDFIKYVKSPLERRLGYDEASELVGRGSVWLDVRPRAAYKRAHIQGAKSIPFEQLRQQLSDLDPEVLYVVYCDDGHASATAAYLMLEFGLQATVLDGGLQRLDDGLLASSERENVVALDVGGGEREVAAGMQQQLLHSERQVLIQEEQIQRLKQALEKTKGMLRDAERGHAEFADAQGGLTEQIEQLKEQLTEKEQLLEQSRRQADETGRRVGELEAQLRTEQGSVEAMRLSSEAQE
ncbi:MAG: hypothetical protein B0D85_04980, partial [Candidatus Sedimenticola endophacoides]